VDPRDEANRTGTTGASLQLGSEGSARDGSASFACAANFVHFYIYLPMVHPAKTPGRCGRHGLFFWDANLSVGSCGDNHCLHPLLRGHEACVKSCATEGRGHGLLPAVARVILKEWPTDPKLREM